MERKKDFRIFADTGRGFEETAYEDEGEILLPDGTQNIRLEFSEGNRILNLKKVQGYCGFWYDMAFQTDGFRLGRNLFLLQKDGSAVTGEDFRFQTTKVRIEAELTVVTAESAERIAHDISRLQEDRDTLERKWKYQIQVYDAKVEDVKRLEQDKVELNRTINELREEIEFWRSAYHQMEGSLSWRITGPIRSANASVKKLREQGPLKQMKKDYLQKLREESGEKTGARFTLISDVSALSDEELFAFAERIRRQSFPNTELVISGGGKTAQWLSGIDPDIRAAEPGLKSQIAAASGQLIGFMRPQDILSEDALRRCAEMLAETGADLVYTDSDFFTEDIKDADEPWFKPDFSPDYLRSRNYIRGFFAAKRELFTQIDLADEALTGAHAYGLILRLSELASAPGAGGIAHVPEKLYFAKREHLQGVQVSAENDASLRALSEHLARCALSGTPEVLDKQKGLYRIRYELREKPLISILIPNKDHAEDLRRCIDSILRLSTYRNLEIVVVENNSAKKETFDFYEELQNGYADRFSKIATEDGGKTLVDAADAGESIEIRVIQWKQGFNFSAINNFGVPETRGEYLLLLNNDIEVITPDWIEEMLMYAQREDVGAVGAKLYYTDDTVQHAGVIIGLGGVAAHSHLSFPKNAPGYMDRLAVVQNLSAVTAACLLMRRSVYEEIGGMDTGYEVAFNDADFCMRIRAKGYLVVFTPFAELYHDESKSRGIEDTPEKAERFESEVQRFKAEWGELLDRGDPYYNPNLTTDEENFAIKESLP